MASNPYYNITPYGQPNTTMYSQNAPTQYIPNMYYSQPVMLQQSRQQPATNYSQQHPNIQIPNQMIYPSLQDFPPLTFNDGWQDVKNSRKRQRRQEEEEAHSSQNNSSKYWLSNATSISNRFSSLDDEEVSMETNNDNKEQKKDPKPPPIFVDGVEDIKPLITELNIAAKGNYTTKAITNKQVKIEPKDSQTYTNIIKMLKEKSTQYHTYKAKQDKSFRVVLKNVHHSTDVEDIKQSIQALGHEVTNVWNIKQQRSNSPLPMFFIDLKQNESNKDIYKVKLLMNTSVTFEAPHARRDIPQCMRCQYYGHTKNFCNKNPRCVKCIGNHLTKDCPRKTKSEEVRCVNCNENHPANYKGCIVHKQLQQKLYPQLRSKSEPPKYFRTQYVQPNITYAGRMQNESQQINNLNQSPVIVNQQNSDMEELKHMMKQLINQMGTMMNLITTLVSKMP